MIVRGELLNPRLIRVEEDGVTIRYRYDAMGNLLSTNGKIIRLEYDRIGKNKIAMNDLSMGRWTYQYNAFGELIKQTDNKKQISTMVYDVLGRIIERNDNGRDKTTWHYDNQWKGAADYQLNKESRTDYRYDQYGRLSESTQTIGKEKVIKHYDYDAFGRLKAVSYPHMSMVNTWDTAGKLKSVSAPKNELWTYEYIKLEDHLKQTVQYIGELQAQAKTYENRVHTLSLRSETYRRWSSYYFRVEKRYDGYAKYYQSRSDAYERTANIYQRKASYYRSKAEHYYRYLGNMVLKLQKVKNGRAYYSTSWCAKKDWKGRCKRREVRSATLPEWMVSNWVYKCVFWWKSGWGCT